MKRRDKKLIYTASAFLAAILVIITVIGFSVQDMNRINDDALGFRVEELFEKSRFDTHRNEIDKYQFNYPEEWAFDSGLYLEEKSSLSKTPTKAIVNDRELGYARSFAVNVFQEDKGLTKRLNLLSMSTKENGDSDNLPIENELKKLLKEQFNNQNVEVTKHCINDKCGFSANNQNLRVIIFENLMIKMKSENLSEDSKLEAVLKSFKFLN